MEKIIIDPETLRPEDGKLKGFDTGKWFLYSLGILFLIGLFLSIIFMGTVVGNFGLTITSSVVALFIAVQLHFTFFRKG